jgi:hypothetical protein
MRGRPASSATCSQLRVFQFLDGGELDPGLVRDAKLNAANDFELFSERFEGVLPSRTPLLIT